jgi:hypothetical protein
MRFRTITLVFSLSVLTALAISVRSSAQELVEFDAPRAGTVSSPACAPSCGTFAFANNDLGAIVGYYTDAKVVPHGFLRTPSGQIISFNAPGAGLGAGLNEGTVAYSINDLGVIAGAFEDRNLLNHGFVRYADGSFTTFEAPEAGTGANQGTYAWNINLEGTTAGIYIDGSGVYHGFVRLPKGETKSFDPPGSILTYVCEETCLNFEGAIVGFYYDANDTPHGFVREPDGTITGFDAPGAGTGAFEGTIGASINLEGTITGYFVDSHSVFHGFVRTRGGNFTTFDVPSDTGAVETAAFSINLLGAVTGEFLDASNVMHGFSRSPGCTFATFDAPGAGTAAGQGTRPSTNNLEGAVVGWWVDGSSLNYGFLWIPRDGF